MGSRAQLDFEEMNTGRYCSMDFIAEPWFGALHQPMSPSIPAHFLLYPAPSDTSHRVPVLGPKWQAIPAHSLFGRDPSQHLFLRSSPHLVRSPPRRSPFTRPKTMTLLFKLKALPLPLGPALISLQRRPIEPSGRPRSRAFVSRPTCVVHPICFYLLTSSQHGFHVSSAGSSTTAVAPQELAGRDTVTDN